MSECHCDHVKYSPICGEDGYTYISPCHAGCLDATQQTMGPKKYKNCMCISNSNSSSDDYENIEENIGGTAVSGTCAVNCNRELLLFMIVKCINKFIGATGRASNFLVSLRSVNPEDKTVSMGVGFTILCLFALIPSPVFFGWLIDQTCIVWGTTCVGKANCWLYDGFSMRYYINIASTISVIIGALCDCGVWYFVKNLIIFDEEKQIDDEISYENFKNSKSTETVNK